MTDKGYDPFSYGRLQGAPNNKAGGGSDTPEDLLFTASSATPTSVQARDSSWDPPEDTSAEFKSVDFGADILGEQPAAARTAAAPAKPRANAASADEKAPVRPVGTAAVVTARAPTPGRGTVKAPRSQPVVTPMPLPSRGGIVVVAPLLILVAGMAVAAWFQFGRQNAVFAGIAGALSLALGGVAWFGLKR